MVQLKHLFQKVVFLRADRVSDGYVADNWGWEAITHQRHDSAALDRAGKSFNSVSIGENLNTWQGLTGPFTLNDIKNMSMKLCLTSC